MRRLDAPIRLSFEFNTWLERLVAVRRNRPVAYAVAIAAVLLAFALRYAVEDRVGPHMPFGVFFPAVLMAALVGGVGPALVAAGLSALLAWRVFLPPELSGGLESQRDAGMALFLAINAMNIALAVMLSGLVERVVAQNQNIRLLLESSRDGIAVVDEHGAINLANTRLATLIGYEPQELAGLSVNSFMAERAERGSLGRGVVRAPSPGDAATRTFVCRHRDGSMIPVALSVHSVQRGQRRGMLATVADLSEREQANRNRSQIEEEGVARGTDLLTLFRALVDHATETSGSADELARRLGAGLDRVTRAMRLPASGSDQVSLAWLADRPGITFEGDDVDLAPRLARLLALVLNELEENARRHGALSASSGHVQICADMEGHHLMVLWRESGGPPSVAPARPGLGFFILQSVADRFGLHPTLDLDSAGVRYRLHIDVAALEPAVMV
jgi:PAS domain S-box-containing protein